MDESRYRTAERELWSSLGVEPSERMVDLPRSRTRVRVLALGRGRPVLFVHGAASGASVWMPLAARLDGVRCVLLDRPGCGLSPPPAADLTGLPAYTSYADHLVGDVLDGLELTSAPVVSTSLGSFFTLRAAAAAPRITRVLSFGYVPGAPMERVPLSMRLATLPGIRQIAGAVPPTRSMVTATLRQLGLGPALRDGRVDDRLVDWFLALLRDTDTMRHETRGPKELLPGRGDGARASWLLPHDLLAKVTCPVHLAWGRDDPIGGAASAEELTRRLPAGTLDLWSDTGHAPWLDDVDRAAELVRDLVASS